MSRSAGSAGEQNGERNDQAMATMMSRRRRREGSVGIRAMWRASSVWSTLQAGGREKSGPTVNILCMAPMTLDLTRNAFVDTIRFPKARRARRSGSRKSIPTVDTLTGIELRIQKVLVKDNKTTKVWPFPGYSDLYVIITTIDDLKNDPFKLTLEGFADVDDDEVLPLERTAYYWKEGRETPIPPGQIHLVLSVIKSNQGIRKLGKTLSTLKDRDDYRSVVTTVVEAIATGGTSTITSGLLALTGVVGALLGDVDDTPLITQVLSFTDINGDFASLGKHVSSRGNRYINLDMALVVRDAHRERRS